MKKGIGKEIVAVLLGFAIASVPTVVQNIDYNPSPRVHMATKLDWGSDDKTNIDDPEDYCSADRGDLNVVLYNGKAKPLANVAFTLYTALEKDGTLQANKVMGTYTTDDKGTFKVKHILEDRLYCLKESDVSEEHSLDKYFVMSSSKSSDYADGVQVLKKNDTLSLIANENLDYTYKVEVQWVPPINTPEKVRVNLLRNGNFYDYVELSEANNWKYTFTNLLSTGEYTVEEDALADYNVYYQYLESNGSTTAILRNTFDLGSYSSWMVFIKVGFVVALIGFLALCWYFIGYLPRSRKRHRKRGARRR